MDATTQLALMTKAKRLFEPEGTFLSFPVLRRSFTRLKSCSWLG